ncbi:hypothetical protein pb186bvf_009322 [Paramecium bursaria]
MQSYIQFWDQIGNETKIETNRGFYLKFIKIINFQSQQNYQLLNNFSIIVHDFIKIYQSLKIQLKVFIFQIIEQMFNQKVIYYKISYSSHYDSYRLC